jgi:hypothetical protein
MRPPTWHVDARADDCDYGFIAGRLAVAEMPEKQRAGDQQYPEPSKLGSRPICGQASLLSLRISMRLRSLVPYQLVLCLRIHTLSRIWLNRCALTRSEDIGGRANEADLAEGRQYCAGMNICNKISSLIYMHITIHPPQKPRTPTSWL